MTVNTTSDDPSALIPGKTTLRDAINQADTDTSNSYVIKFSVSLPAMINLTSALPDLSNNIAINGPGASKLTVQRDSSAAPFSIFTVDSGVAVSSSGVTISGGAFEPFISGVGPLGGIYNAGTLKVSNSTVTDNYAYYGGCIENVGTATVIGSTFTGNYAAYGGGLYNNDGTVMVSNSTFASNVVIDNAGGGLYNNGGTVTVRNSTFASNRIVNLPGSGGGICNDNGGTLMVSSSTFTNNSATFGSGLRFQLALSYMR